MQLLLSAMAASSAELASAPGTANTKATSSHFFKDHQGRSSFEISRRWERCSKRGGFFPFGKRSGTAPAQAFRSSGTPATATTTISV